MTLAAALLAVAVAGAALIYFVVFPTSSPKPFSISSSTVASATSGRGASTGDGTTALPAEPDGQDGLSGTWSVGSGSEAGYRVREKLAFLPAESDAVGRTPEVTGSASFKVSKGTVTIAAASFKVAVNTLKSDRSMRDEKIHEIGLESSRYPTATFVLSKPVAVAERALQNKVARVLVTGVFNIHGTSKRETLPVDMSLSGSTFTAVGSLTFPWSEFGMVAPSVGGFVSVTEHATMEFELRLRRA